MRDEHNGVPHIPQLFQFHKKFGNLLRSQYGSRFIQNQYFGTAQQRLHNLDLLLYADGALRHSGAGIHLKVILLGNLLGHAYGFFHIKKSATQRLHAQHQVFGHGQLIHQHKVLVHHAYPMPNSIQRILKADGLALQHNLAFCRLQKTEQDLH